MQNVLLIHIITTLFMTSICWFVQIVHYPLFRDINPSDFSYYERKNVFYTALVAVPIMVVESLSGIYLLYQQQDALNLINVILLGVIAISTFALQAPIHLKLMLQASPKLIKRLILTNWIRTISWTIRSGIVIYFLNRLIS